MPTPTAADPRTRQPKQTTRSTILRRAFEMYVAHQLDQGDEKLQRVLDDLGYTTGAAYQIWASQAAFRSDLRIYIAENIEHTHLDHLHQEILRNALTESSDFQTATIRIAEILIKTWHHSTASFLWRFHALPDDRQAEITEALIDSHQRTWWYLTELLVGALFQQYGYRLADGETSDELSRAVSRVLDGERLTNVVSPAPVDQIELTVGLTTSRLARDIAMIIRARATPTS